MSSAESFISVFIIIFFPAAEVQAKLVDSERARTELADRVTKLLNESESISSQLEQAELKASTAMKSAATMESQLSENQVRV